MHHQTRSTRIDGLGQLGQKHPVIGHLVLGDVSHDNRKLQLREILLKFKSPVNRQENVELFLG